MEQGKSYAISKQMVWEAFRLDNKSRMSREAHVRFCEGLGVKLPRATRRRSISAYGKSSGDNESLWVTALAGNGMPYFGKLVTADAENALYGAQVGCGAFRRFAP